MKRPNITDHVDTLRITTDGAAAWGRAGRIFFQVQLLNVGGWSAKWCNDTSSMFYPIDCEFPTREDAIRAALVVARLSGAQ